MATLIRALHALYVGLWISAPLWILAGVFLKQAWLYDLRLRRLHLACVGFAVVQFAFDLPCPLTLLESWFAGGPSGTSFVNVDVPAGALIGFFVAYGAATSLAHLAPRFVALAPRESR